MYCGGGGCCCWYRSSPGIGIARSASWIDRHRKGSEGEGAARWVEAVEVAWRESSLSLASCDE